MKDILQDLVAHTHALGFIPLLKISNADDKTIIEAISDDKKVILKGEIKVPVDDFNGVFGMPNLNKLDIHLKCPEYKENAKIFIGRGERNGEVMPTEIHFENEAGDFQNDYRFMVTEVINAKMKAVNFKGANWDIEFEPTLNSIQRLKFQASAHSEESTVDTITENSNLIFKFGAANTHAGSFVFQPNVNGKLKQIWSWPVNQVLSILNLPGTITMRIADGGLMQISVDSGIAVYDYYIPAQTK